jgi:glycine cleavage system H protein
MSLIPAELQYTKEHEWVAPTETSLRFRMGITDFAQAALGDIVYVQMPKFAIKSLQMLSAGKLNLQRASQKFSHHSPELSLPLMTHL